MKSVWNHPVKTYGSLKEDIERDVVVIGGGIAGFLTAFRLAEAGKSVTLVEADTLFSGVTGHTTAKITAHQGNIYADLYKKYGKAVASIYYKSQCEGIRNYLALIDEYNIDCDLEELDGIVYTRRDSETIGAQERALRSAGAECEKIRLTEPIRATAALRMPGQYVFDPVKFLTALPVNFEIFDHTRVIGAVAERKFLITQHGSIRAKSIVVATHFPIINSHGGYSFKLHPSMSYTVAIPERRADAALLDEEQDGLSVRPYAGGTILGGYDGRTGRGNGDEYDRLSARASELFGCEPTHRWCAEDCMTFDGLPYAGAYAKNLPDVYVVTGFNKWGMTNAMVAASVIADLICGKPNAYSELFSPQRKMKGALGKFLVNACVNVADLLLGAFRVPFRSAEDVPKGSGMIVWHKGRRRAVYRDDNDELHVIDHRCPHKKGELKWNAADGTWDCPCHGSRFTVDGDIVTEPAVRKCTANEE